MLKLIFLNLVSFLLLCCNTGCAQTKTIVTTAGTSAGDTTNNSFVFEKLLPGNFTHLEVDVLDNIYLLTGGNQLKKMNAKGDSIAVYNDVKQYGNPHLLDVSNPLKILLYYKNFSTVVILDRLLTLRNNINFRKGNIFAVKCLATSYDNNIWLFDDQDFKLKKIDEDGKILQETTDCRLLFDPAPSPQRIIDQENYVYLYDPAQGFYIFDYYGSFKSNLPFLNWQHIAVSGNKLYGFVNNILYSYELKTLVLKSYPVPASFEGYSEIRVMNGKVYLLKKSGIEIYRVQ